MEKLLKIGSAVVAMWMSFSSSVYAEENASTSSINYNYLYADASSGSLNEDIGGNSNVTAVGVGGSMLYKNSWLLVTDYAARFVHPENLTNEYYSLRPGVGYKYSITDKLDVSSRVRYGILWSSVTDDRTNATLSSDTNSIYGVDLMFTYKAMENLEVTLGGELSRSSPIDEDIFILRGDYYIDEHVAIGGFYTYRDAQTSRTNEGGISVRYAY
ncbi:porin family protein [Vibrio sp. S4M6]|uniref:transporter n=1 Tax=Vibrio sinus TaxID=2946865 RepID=UPI00202A382B|nr:transporter [Vibrio sinus]MCL9782007.1 porin family protein [Vibrio sinus]